MKTNFVCTNCGYSNAKWLGKCPSCGEWNTFEEQVVASTKKTEHKVEKTYVSTIIPKKLDQIKSEGFTRFSSGISELDNVLGGGIVPSSLILLGGDPGIGKSTILTQVAGSVAKDKEVLYVSAEESCYQTKMRCDRLKISSQNLSVASENNAEEICALIESNKYCLIIIDSISAIYLPDLPQTTGSISQVKECASAIMRSCKSSKTTVFLIGHVNKDGALAGPKVLEHIVDTVLYLEGETSSNFKIVRSVKNRFGSTNEVGIFDMTEDGLVCVEDPSEILLSQNRGLNAGAVATPFVSGNRCLFVEIQSLTSQTVFAMPRRLINGSDYNKLVLLTAVLEKKGHFKLYDQDVYVNIMGGIKIFEPSVDLAIVCAIASAVQNVAIAKTTAIVGEIGLTGEIRSVDRIEKRIAECIKLGFTTLILPKYNQKKADKYKDKINLQYYGHIYPLIRDLFGGN